MNPEQVATLTEEEAKDALNQRNAQFEQCMAELKSKKRESSGYESQLKKTVAKLIATEEKLFAVQQELAALKAA
jgi:SMC interacting uncharacterized protein involved in chromosome segregation